MKTRNLVLLAALIQGFGFSVMAKAGEQMKTDTGMQHIHMMHMHMVDPASMPAATKRLVKYTLPKVRLVREDHKRVTLPAELNDGKPVVMTFVFTTCTAVCPIISHTLMQMQDKLGVDSKRIHLATITIDPENDTPAQLVAYEKKYHAGPEWHSYTGTYKASEIVQKAFDVYHGDKMDHDPVIFLRRAPGQKWVRIDGFVSANELLGELQGMLASSK